MDEGQRLRFFESPMKEDAADDRPGLEYSSGKDSDMDMGEEVGEEVGEAVHMGEGMGVRARRAARQKGSSFGPMKEDADRDFSWGCSNCTFQNAAGMWQCEMCSHHKPGESYYCVLVLSKHAAACFVGDSHSLLFFVVDALAGAVVLRMTDSGPAAVQATSTAPLLPMVAGDAGAGKRSTTGRSCGGRAAERTPRPPSRRR